MNLQETIREVTARPETRSVVKDWILTLNDEDRDTAQKALLNPDVGTTALHRAFVKHGATFSKYAVEIYRQKLGL